MVECEAILKIKSGRILLLSCGILDEAEMVPTKENIGNDSSQNFSFKTALC